MALVWCYPDESSTYAYRVLDILAAARAVVPSLWTLEIANAMLVGQRRHRLGAGETARFLGLVYSLPIDVDPWTADRAMRETFQLARSHDLSACDAAYLELAVREGLRLATVDEKLRRAAASAGVALAG